MDLQCHPIGSSAKTEADLQAEQDEFFLSGSQNCVQIVSNEDKEIRNKIKNIKARPSIQVLNEVFERPTDVAAKPPVPPVFKAPTKPTIIKSKPKLDSEPISNGFEEMKAEINRENEEKLAHLSQEEIESLREEVLDGIPESFLDKLRAKKE